MNRGYSSLKRDTHGEARRANFPRNVENDRNKFRTGWRKLVSFLEESRRGSVEKLPGLFRARLRSAWQRSVSSKIV